MEQIGQINNNCVTKATLQGCADGVPYLLIVSDGCCTDSVLSYVNLNTGDISSTMPVNFAIGECPEEECNKIYKDACANGVPYLVSVSEDCNDAVATIEYINLITGGKTTTAPTDLQYWSCEAIPTQSCVAFMETESFTATAGQTTFNISQVASGDVRLSRNGATLHDGAAAVSGTTVTYVPGINNSEPLLAGDRIDISYIYVDCEQVDKGFTDCKGDELAASTALVTCAALNPEHFEIDPATGQISSKCCDTVPADQITCYEYCAPVSGEGTFVHKEDYNSVQAYPYFKNLTYVTGAEIDGQYSIRTVSGRNTPALNLPILSGIGDYAVLANPLLIFEATGTGMVAGTQGYAKADVLERASGNKANFIYQVIDASNNQVIASLEPGLETNSWTSRQVNFTVPASGSVKFQILSKTNGSSNGTDPCIDDTKIAYYPDNCVTYQKVVSNGVTTWYDQSGNVVSQPTVALTLIACPASSECVCDPADFISADANNTLTVGSDGKIYNAASATPEFAQTVYVNSTSPSTATIFDLENPPTTNDNALKADVNNIYIGTDGSAWTYNSSTGTYSTYAYPTVPTVTETNNSIKVNNTLQQWNVDTTASTGIRTVTFPIPYSSVPSVQLTAINADGQARTPSLVSVSTTGFSYRVWLDTNNTASAANVYWTAIGKKF